MIDTIVLVLPMSEFSIKEPNKFTPPFEEKRSKKNTRFKYIYNPDKYQKKASYYPRLTILQQSSEYGSDSKLKIEFSVPKLLFGNNFIEIGGDSFDLVINNLFKKLDDMSIVTRKDYLKNAYVQKIDYSKNIILEKHISCSMLISELSKLNLNSRLDLTKTDYRNDGHAIAYHSNSFEIKIYDKVKDLEQGKKYGEKRNIERSKQQLNLLDLMEGNEKFADVIRIEGRFSRVKLKSIFKKINIESKLIFQELFNQNLSRQVLLHFFDQIKKDLYIMHFDLDDIGNLICNIKSKFPRMKSAKIQQIIGFINVVQQIGNRATRIELNIPNHGWYRLQKQLKEIELDKKNHKFLAILDLESKLKEFKMIKRLDLENLKKCNENIN